MKIGIVGYGLLGKYLHEKLSDETSISFIYDLNKEVIDALPKGLVLSTPAELSHHLERNKVDLVIEVATFEAVRNLASIVLPYSDMLTFSACAFADEQFSFKAEQLCRRFNRTIFIPHGAVLGYDGIFDGREILQSVRITTTKKPANLGSDVKEKTVLFEGPVREACKKFPRNVNVHAGIAIAGLGFDKTQSCIIADPDVEGNTHLIEVLADDVRFRIEVCSVPKGLVTGAYTLVSALNTVKRIISHHSGFTVI